jgi:hypothetical protein
MTPTINILRWQPARRRATRSKYLKAQPPELASEAAFIDKVGHEKDILLVGRQRATKGDQNRLLTEGKNCFAVLYPSGVPISRKRPSLRYP